MHPRDLEKLRVHSFGYISVTGGDNDNSSSNNSSSAAERRSVSSLASTDDSDDHRGADAGGSNRRIIFCRAVPDNSLSQGETHTPAWILQALGARRREHLIVSAVAIPAAPQGSELPTCSRLVVSHVRFSGKASGSAASRQMGEVESGGGIAGDVLRHPKLGQAIARRIAGCLARVGSMLAAEVLGKMIVMRVISITETHDSSAPAVTSSAVSMGASKKPNDALESGRGVVGSWRHKHERERNNEGALSLRLITSSSEVTVLYADSRPGNRVLEDGGFTFRQEAWSQGQRPEAHRNRVIYE